MREIVLGERYTDRYAEISGVAMEITAFVNGCFMVSLQTKPDDKGERGKPHNAFDSYLDDEHGAPVERPQVLADRSQEIVGKKYRDRMSGLTGTATSVRFLLNGTEQVGVQPMSVNGREHPEAWSIDSGQLEEIVAPVPVTTGARVGGPSMRTPRV